LGRQIAVKLATEGVKRIGVHYRRGKSDAETTLSLVEAAGASAVLVQGDIADTTAAENLVREAAEKLGGCDIYVQSVVPPLGEIYEQVMATELSLEKWQAAFDTQARAFSFVVARQRSICPVEGGLSVCPTRLAARQAAGSRGWPWDRRKQRWIV
jgi:NAD(P)-dependent dehydrogenase (short-subunit alcohol dehydrogenase family)